jgi:hypothetical protein
MKPLRVWGWSGWLDNSTPTREVMAAHSKAEVARAAGVKSPDRLWNLGVTANEEELRQALSEPGAVFFYLRSEENMRPRNLGPAWRRRQGPSRYGPGASWTPPSPSL